MNDPQSQTTDPAVLQKRLDRERSARQQAEQIAERATRELYQALSEIEQTNKELNRSNQDLNDFAYIASHDLREPLRGIHNYSSFLLEDYADRLGDDGRDKLETLKRLAQRLDALIDSLLTFSRVGRLQLEIGDTNLNDVLKEVTEVLQVTLTELAVELRVPRPLPTIHCDPIRVNEVFRNLISNAIKFNDKPEKWIEIGYLHAVPSNGAGAASGDSHAPTSDYVFYVRDNGIGIREKHQESIFGLFKRLHVRDKYGPGTGAGLTIVKKIVERHGGRVWVESEPDQGSTFYFMLASGDDSQDGQKTPAIDASEDR